MTAFEQVHKPEDTQPLGYGDCVRFSELAEERFGLHFSQKRRTELERGVKQAFAASTCTDLDEYYNLLQDSESSAIHTERLINALTISETHFFRDESQFAALREHVLPQIIERQRSLRTLRIWSAGCASGEEPYSIAILLRELLPDVDDWAITILGTDLNTEALARARKAIYGNWAFREEQAKQLRPRYFSKLDNRYELDPQVRRMVTFAQLNLAADAYPAYETNTTFMNLILCRNVTIYFTAGITQRIADRFHDALTEGGWLVVGHSEHSLVTYRRFKAHNFPGAILYQRGGQATELPKDWNWPIEPRRAPIPVEKPAPSIDVQPHAQPSPISIPAEEEKVDPLEQARELLEYGHSEQARDLLLGLVEAGSRHAPTCAMLGRAYANLGCWEEAEHWCREAIKADRLALDAYYTLALVLQHQGQHAQAIEAMKKVVYIDRHHVPAHFGLADLYHSNGQLSRALKSLDNARRLLEGQVEDALVSGTEGITVGRLRDVIVRQQQQWGAEAAGQGARE
ncbi:MAG: tetratricopeptide repeat protein [Anaerolineae bacterium]|nr:tetratricopeptide repeat protein [Anaerolineae bacterium]